MRVPEIQAAPDPEARIANPASRKFILRGEGVAENQEAVTAIVYNIAAALVTHLEEGRQPPN